MNEVKILNEIWQHSEVIIIKLIVSLVGFACCFALFVGTCFGLTQMSFVQSVLTALIPSLIFGIWCGYTAMEDEKVK